MLQSRLNKFGAAFIIIETIYARGNFQARLDIHSLAMQLCLAGYELQKAIRDTS